MRYFIRNLSNRQATLTAYLHDQSPDLSNCALRPAVLICPGGGYFVCSDREAEPVALAYMAEGYHTFVLRYTVGHDVPFEPALEDAKEALHTIRDNAEDWGIDADRLAVCGFSAGGHLAACMGTMANPRPAAMILGYPVILAEMGNDIRKELPNVPDYVDKTTSPAYIFTTCTDEIVPVRNSLELAAKLDKYHVPFEFHVFPAGNHGLSLSKPHTANGHPDMVEPRVEAWFAESCKFLVKIWGSFSLDNQQAGLGMKLDELGIDTPLKILMADENSRKIVLSLLPQMDAMLEQAPSAGMYSLSVMNRYSPEVITDEMLERFSQLFQA